MNQQPFLNVKPFFSGVTPVPPSVNAAYRVVTVTTQQHEKKNRLGSSAELEQFKRDAALMLSQADIDWSLVNAIRASRRKVPLRVEMRVYFRTPWKRDLDDIIKFAIDAAFAKMELNDALVVDLHPKKYVDPIAPRVEIEVYVTQWNF